MRTLAIGDVHGCLRELRDLIDMVDYRPDQDRLVFLGDLVDRGPESAGVIQYIRHLERYGSVVTVKGNHDDNVVRWFQRERKARETGVPNGMKPPPPHRLVEWAGITDDDIDWMAALPVVAEAAPGWLAVHAGFEDRPMGKQREDKCMRTRWIDGTTGKMVPIGEGDPLDAQPPGSVWWTERWRGSDNVVYGHAVHDLKEPRVDTNDDGIQCWGIDTGVCFGGHLTALCLETRQLWQVQAHVAYREFRAYRAQQPTSGVPTP